MGMRMNLGTTALLATLCVTAAACNKPAQKAEDATSKAESKAETAVTAKVDPARAYPLVRKPGLWQLTNTPEGGAEPLPMTICVDAALGEKVIQTAGQIGDMECAQQDIRGTATGVIIDQVCTRPNGGTVTSHMEIVSSSDAAFRQTVDDTYSPAQNGRTTSKYVLDGQWQGACPTDMKAGDIRMQGMTVNFYKMVEAAKKRKD